MIDVYFLEAERRELDKVILTDTSQCYLFIKSFKKTSEKMTQDLLSFEASLRLFLFKVFFFDKVS
jgi:hypothetical protein